MDMELEIKVLLGFFLNIAIILIFIYLIYLLIKFLRIKIKEKK